MSLQAALSCTRLGRIAHSALQPNTNVMESYPLGPYLPTGGAYDHHLTGYGNGSFNPGGMSGVEEHSFPTAPGLSEEIHNAFNGLQLSGAAATQRLDPNGSVDVSPVLPKSCMEGLNRNSTSFKRFNLWTALTATPSTSTSRAVAYR